MPVRAGTAILRAQEVSTWLVNSHLPPAQRVDLVLALRRGTEKLEVLARRHQVSANTLRRWRDEFVAADPATAPARILTPYEVYVKGYAVNPPSWSRWVGWLDERDQEQVATATRPRRAAQPPNRTAPKISA